MKYIQILLIINQIRKNYNHINFFYEEELKKYIFLN